MGHRRPAVDAVECGEYEDERVLVSAASKGDQRAFEVLYIRYWPRVRALCARTAGDWSRAEDLAQEAFVRAYTHASSIRPDSTIWPWLATIARNVCTDELRVRARVRLSSWEGLTSGERPRNGSSAIESDELVLLRAQLAGALATLDAHHRGVVWLQSAEQMSLKEIARFNGQSVNAVRNASWRARTALRRVLAPTEKTGSLVLAPLALTARLVRRMRTRLSEQAARLRASSRLQEGFLEQASAVIAAFTLAMVSLTYTAFSPTSARREIQAPARPFLVGETLSLPLQTSPWRDQHATGAQAQKPGTPGGTLEIDINRERYEGAATPRSASLVFEVRAPDGSVVLRSETFLECQPRERPLLPPASPIQTDC